MRIIYSIEDLPLLQDCYEEAKQSILGCSWSWNNWNEFNSVLETSLAFVDDDYFNLRLWMHVLNKIDEVLSLLLEKMFKPDSKGHLRDDWYLSLSASSNELSEFNNMVNTIKVILKWTANVLSHSFNKNFYNSTELIVQIIKYTSIEDLAIASMGVITALALPPPNHRNVCVYAHTTVLHKTLEFTTPLFDILLAGHNLSCFNVSDIVNSQVDVVDAIEDTTGQRAKWWFAKIRRSMLNAGSASNEIGDPSNPWTWYSCYLQAFLVVVRAHKEIRDVSNFFAHKTRLQHDLVYLLQQSSRSSEMGQSSVPGYIRTLAAQCICALFDRSENHFTNATKEGDYNGPIRMISPFDLILQSQLGIDSSEVQGLLPNTLRNELQWLSTTFAASLTAGGLTAVDGRNLAVRKLDFGVESLDNTTTAAVNGENACIARLKDIENVLLMTLSSLPFPKSIQSFVNNGIIDSILSVMKASALTDFSAAVKSQQPSSHPASRPRESRHWLLYCIVSLAVQILDMIISAKRGAIEAFYAAGGPVVVLERLKQEAAHIGEEQVKEYETLLGDLRTPFLKASVMPICYQSLVLSLTAILDALLNNTNHRELRSGSHTALNQMDLIRGELFHSTIATMCNGIAGVVAPILSSLIRLLCELVNNDNATPAVINLFLQGSVMRHAYTAVSSPHIKHDIETVLSILNLMTGLCIKEDGIRLINAKNPFAVFLSVFSTPTYLLSESMLLHPTFAVQIGNQCGDLVRTNPQLVPLFTKTLVEEMKKIGDLALNVSNSQLVVDQKGGSVKGKKTVGERVNKKTTPYSDVVIHNMIIAVLMCFSSVVEKSNPFAKEFIKLEGLAVLYQFMNFSIGTRKHMLITLASKIGVTSDDKPGNNHLRRALMQAYTKLCAQMGNEVLTDLTERIASCSVSLADDLTAFRAVHPMNQEEPLDGEATLTTTAGEDGDMMKDAEEDEENDDEGDKKGGAKGNKSKKSGKRKLDELKDVSKKVKNKQKAEAIASAARAASGAAGASSSSGSGKRNRGGSTTSAAGTGAASGAATSGSTAQTFNKVLSDFNLHRLLDFTSDSSADFFDFDYSENSEFFAVAFSLLRLECLYSLLADVSEFCVSVTNFQTPQPLAKPLPYLISALGSGCLVNQNCISEIARAHENVVIKSILKEETLSAQQMDISFDIYIYPAKQKMRVRNNISSIESDHLKSGKGSYQLIDTNCFVHASERICNEESKSLTYFKIGDKSYIRKRDVDGVPNLEVIGLFAAPHASSGDATGSEMIVTSEADPANATAARRDQSISLYRVAKNILRAVSNSYNDLISVVLNCFKSMNEATKIKEAIAKLMPYVMNDSIKSLLFPATAPVYSIQNYLQVKYVVDTCTAYYGVRSFHDFPSNVVGHPLALATMYQYDQGALFAMMIQSCCRSVLGCFPSETLTPETAEVNVQERIYCLSIASKHLIFLKNIVQCLCTKDPTSKHTAYPKTFLVRYNCFMSLYEHLKTVWAHGLLCTLPCHMVVGVLELLLKFQECGHKIYLACAEHADDEQLPQQLFALQNLESSVNQDFCRIMLHLLQFGGLHYETLTLPRPAIYKDAIPTESWPLNVTAAENKISRRDFQIALIESFVKGQINHITAMGGKHYTRDTKLDADLPNMDRHSVNLAEKQYKATVSLTSSVFCRLATLMLELNREGGVVNLDSQADCAVDVDLVSIEGLLSALNMLMYGSGTLKNGFCSPFQNALVFLVTAIPEFSEVYASVRQLVTLHATSGAKHASWLQQALLFLDTGIQPFIITKPLLSYCEVFAKCVTGAVKIFASVFEDEKCGELFCNAIDDETISALLMTTPVQFYYPGDKKACDTLSQVVGALNTPQSTAVLPGYQSPMALLRGSSAVLVQSCLSLISQLSESANEATGTTPLLLQSALLVLCHLARDGKHASSVLTTESVALLLGIRVGFERLPLYVNSLLQTALESAQADILRNRMVEIMMAVSESLLMSDLQYHSCEERLKVRFIKSLPKFLQIVEPMQSRDPAMFLSVISDPQVFTQLHNPREFLKKREEAQMTASATSVANTKVVLSLLGSTIKNQLLVYVGKSKETSDTSEYAENLCLCGDFLLTVAELIHSLSKDLGRQLLTELDESFLVNLLLEDFLPAFGLTVSEEGATSTTRTTLEWTKRKHFSGKKEALLDSARAKVYSSGIYLLLSLASVEGHARRLVLTQVSKRLKAITASFASTGVCPDRAAILLLDFINAMDVPENVNSRLPKGVSFLVPTDSLVSVLALMNTQSALVSLQDALNTAEGSLSAITQSLASAINLLLLRGIPAAHTVMNFVRSCQKEAKDEADKAQRQLPDSFWSSDLYLYTNIHASAKRAAASDKKSKDPAVMRMDQLLRNVQAGISNTTTNSMGELVGNIMNNFMSNFQLVRNDNAGDQAIGGGNDEDPNDAPPELIDLDNEELSNDSHRRSVHSHTEEDEAGRPWFTVAQRSNSNSPGWENLESDDEDEEGEGHHHHHHHLHHSFDEMDEEMSASDRSKDKEDRDINEGEEEDLDEEEGMYQDDSEDDEDGDDESEDEDDDDEEGEDGEEGEGPVGYINMGPDENGRMAIWMTRQQEMEMAGNGGGGVGGIGGRMRRGSDLSFGSDDDSDGEGHMMGEEDEDEEEDYDDFDMMSAPPDSDDDDDSELNELGSLGEQSLDNATIYVDEPSVGQEDTDPLRSSLTHGIKIDNNIYHMIGYLYYTSGLESRSLFNDVLNNLLGHKDHTFSAMHGVEETAERFRSNLGLPAVSERVWASDLDFVDGLLNCVLLAPLVSFMMLKQEFLSENEKSQNTGKSFLVVMDHIMKAIGNNPAVNALQTLTSSSIVAFSIDDLIRHISPFAKMELPKLMQDVSADDVLRIENVEFLSVGTVIINAFVNSVAKHREQSVVGLNFNRSLNMKSMSKYRLCLASNQTIRNYQMSLIFMYSSKERTSAWDRDLLMKLVDLISSDYVSSNFLLFVFEIIAYQCDELFRSQKLPLSLRHALLSPPASSSVGEGAAGALNGASDNTAASAAAAAAAAAVDESVPMVSDSSSSSTPAPVESVLSRLLKAVQQAIQQNESSEVIKELLHLVNHLLRLCTREENYASTKVALEQQLHLFVPVIDESVVSSLLSLFLRTDLFVTKDQTLLHFNALLDFLAKKKANWVHMVTAMKDIGEALMRAVTHDTEHMLTVVQRSIPLDASSASASLHLLSGLESPGTKSRAMSIVTSPLPEMPPVESTAAPAAPSSVVPSILFPNPNAERRLVHFFDLLQQITNTMNTTGIKSGNKNHDKTETALNGTQEDLKLLSEALIRLQESVVWDQLVSIMRSLNHLINPSEAASTTAAATPAPKASHKTSSYGTIAAQHQRMLPLIECLFQVATLPTVLFNHLAVNGMVFHDVKPLEGATTSNVTDTASKKVPKTPGALLRDVSLSGMKTPRTAGGGRDTTKHAMRLGENYVTRKLYMIAEENKKLLNTKMNQNIRLMEQSLQAMRLVPELSKFLDFSVKRKYLRLQIKRLKRPMKWRDMTEEQRIAENVDMDAASDDEEGGAEDDEADNVSINVEREDVLNQSFHGLQNYTPRQILRGTFHITFNGEDGMDAGGLTREWLVILTRNIFKPAYALFSLTGDGVTYQPNPHSGANPEHLDYFKFIGRLVAKAICDNQLLDVHFTRSFYKHILRVPITFADLEVFDAAYYKSLNTLLQYPIEDLGVELTFTATANVFGEEVTSNLVEDGENVPVTDENKSEYVRLMAHHCLTTSFQKQIDAFLDGFHELLPHSLLSHFDPSELELLISGLPEIDLDDLHAHTTYSGYKVTDPVIQIFWSVLRKFNNEEKALFVQFVTGTSKVPLDGFQSLQGSEGVQMFSIHKAYNTSQLPTAHTCFNQLDLPEYATEDIMREKLVMAIRECSEGFGFQ